jgi:hypothetical protein
MTGGRLVKTTGIGLAGVVAGVVLAIPALIGVFLLVGWLSQDSPDTHARKAAQSFFNAGMGGKRTAIVKSCTEISSDEEALIYRCEIVAAHCVRTHRFTVYRDRMYGAVPYSASGFINDHPCGYPSD